MSNIPHKSVRIVGVPLDLGASRRGTDMGPSALRIAGLGAAIRRLGYEVGREEDVPAPAMETRSSDDPKARFKPEILEVCTNLANKVKNIMEANEFPLVIGGDHSIAMGTVRASPVFRDHKQSSG
jgi:arginase